MIPLPLGLFSWLVIGLVSGLSAAKLLPGRPPVGNLLAVLTGITGALAGGLLATALGFGGLAGFDWRGLSTATLAAVLCLLVVRLAKLEDPAS
jgi:uncharacterized membrane protein YeaQ/YmgE (transglycosylase-associated protein family)